MKLAWRIGCYQGCIREMVLAEIRAEQGHGNPGAPSGGQQQMVGGTAAELRAVPELAQVISFATVKRGA